MAVSRCLLIRLGVRYGQRLFYSIKIHHRTLSTSCFQSETTSHVNLLCCSKCNKIRNLNIPSLSVLERRFKNTFEQRYIHTTCIRKENIEDSYDSKQEFSLRKAELDMEYLCDQKNSEEIEANIANRKGVGDIQKLQEISSVLSKKYKIEDLATDIEYQTESEVTEKLQEELYQEALCIPNRTHPDVPLGDENNARVLETVGKIREFTFKPKTVVELGKDLDMLRTDNVGHTTGPKTFYLKGGLAQLETALIRYTVDQLKQQGFRLVSVPDIIHPSIIEACGFKTSGERTQVYRMNAHHHGNLCLAGTGEMPLAGYFHNNDFTLEELPQKVMTVSRCYRRETADVEEEQGIYRVHQFTKVEMFGVTSNESEEESSQLMDDFMHVQRKLFSDIGLQFRILDMPTHELGAPAYRKYDIETYMPAKKFWGEISSTSNCTDYQSRRLNIKYWTPKGDLKHAHTDGSVTIPYVLQPYMKGIDKLTHPDRPSKMKYIVLTKAYKKSKSTSTIT